MVSICSVLFDTLGHVQFTPLPGNAEGLYSRRVAKAATLDGGVAITDKGFAEGDRTLVYRYKPISREHNERALRIVKLHSLVTVANRDGVFSAAPQSFDPGDTENTLTLFVIEKLSED